MHHANGQDVSALLATLTLPELERLKRLITFTIPKATIAEVDWDAVVDEMRNPAPPPPESNLAPDAVEARAAWRRKIDGGRRFELSLFDTSDLGNKPGLRGEELDSRYEQEWRRAEALHSSGMNYEEAWAKIKQECRLGSSSLGVEDPDNLDDEPAPQRRHTP